jgi:hypothetical protein
MPDSFAYRERPAATPRDPLHPALITVIQNRLLEEGAHLADGSRLETSANGVSWRLQAAARRAEGIDDLYVVGSCIASMAMRVGYQR